MGLGRRELSAELREGAREEAVLQGDSAGQGDDRGGRQCRLLVHGPARSALHRTDHVDVEDERVQYDCARQVVLPSGRGAGQPQSEVSGKWSIDEILLRFISSHTMIGVILIRGLTIILLTFTGRTVRVTA